MRNGPTVGPMPFLLLDADKSYADQQSFQTHVNALLNAPDPGLSEHLGGGTAAVPPGQNAESETAPAATSDQPQPAPLPAPDAPVTSPLVAPASTGVLPPETPSPSLPAPDAPVTAPLIAPGGPTSAAAPSSGQQFSPYDAIFAKYAG